jgi:hypothetical protein
MSANGAERLKLQAFPTANAFFADLPYCFFIEIAQYIHGFFIK